MWHTHLVKPLTIITCLSLIFGRVRSPVVGHESDGPQVVFNVHQSHRHDSTHPSLFYQVGYHSYICGVKHSWAQSCITLWSNASRMVTHPCINGARDCLTSVIKCKTFAPCYLSPQIWMNIAVSANRVKARGPGHPHVNLPAQQPFQFDAQRVSPLKDVSGDCGFDNP